MGKFDGILIATDLDGTLFNSEHAVSSENVKAIEYFMAEGGKFTFCTGRVPKGTKRARASVEPNVPMVCFNGSAIYDTKSDSLIWKRFVDNDAVAVVDFVANNIPEAGIAICTAERTYYVRTNYRTIEHQQLEGISEISSTLSDIKEPWKKVIFMVESDKMEALQKLIADSEYFDKYSFVQSYKYYYELLPKGTGKGEAMLELAKICGVDAKSTVGVGDNENDLSLIQLAGVGIAVENAREDVKSAADYITVSNDEHALACIIENIEKGIIKI